MTAIFDPNLGLAYAWGLGFDGWDTQMDANLETLGALVHLSVLSRTTGTPPGSPTNGDRYIIPAGATGAWASQVGKIAVRVAGAWVYYTPKEGFMAWVSSEAVQVVYHSAAWGLLIPSEPYDLHVTYNGRPDSGVALIRMVFTRTTVFQTNLTGSQGNIEVATAADAVMPITKNGSNIGSVNWASGSHVATFTFASPQTFNAGDVMKVLAPSSSDSALADIAITLVGWR